MSNSVSVHASKYVGSHATPCFNSLLAVFDRLKCSRTLRPMMAWAAQHSLEKDLVQLGHMELVSLVEKFDPNVGTTVEQYVGSVLPSRMFSCLRTLKSAYCDPSPSSAKANIQSLADVGTEVVGHDCDENLQAEYWQSDDEFADESSQALKERMKSRMETAWDADRHDAANGDPVADAVQRRQMTMRLKFEIENLPDRQCEIISLLLQDCTESEIAIHLGVSKQAVSKAKLKAMSTLSAVMNGEVQ